MYHLMRKELIIKMCKATLQLDQEVVDWCLMVISNYAYHDILTFLIMTYFCDDKFKSSDLLQLGTHGEVDIPLTPTENVELGSSMKKQGDDEPRKFQDPRAKPEPTAGMWAKFKWAVMYPLYTISHCACSCNFVGLCISEDHLVFGLFFKKQQEQPGAA